MHQAPRGALLPNNKEILRVHPPLRVFRVEASDIVAWPSGSLTSREAARRFDVTCNVLLGSRFGRALDSSGCGLRNPGADLRDRDLCCRQSYPRAQAATTRLRSRTLAEV